MKWASLYNARCNTRGEKKILFLCLRLSLVMRQDRTAMSPSYAFYAGWRVGNEIGEMNFLLLCYCVRVIWKKPKIQCKLNVSEWYILIALLSRVASQYHRSSLLTPRVREFAHACLCNLFVNPIRNKLLEKLLRFKNLFKSFVVTTYVRSKIQFCFWQHTSRDEFARP